MKDIRKINFFKNRDLSGREEKAALLTLAKYLLLEVLSLAIYIDICCFCPVKKEKREPAKQIFSTKLKPKLCLMQEMEKAFSRKFICHQ